MRTVATLSVQSKRSISLKSISIFVSLFLLTISSSLFIKNEGLTDSIEKVTFAILLSSLVISYLSAQSSYKKKYLNRALFIIFVLFSIGIISQNLLVSRKLILLLTVYAILLASIFGEKYLNSINLLRLASYSIFWGSILVYLLAIFNELKTTGSTAGILGSIFSFNGGVVFKNYFGGNMLSIFIGIYISRQCGKKCFSDIILLVLTVLGIVISGSFGSYLLLIVFFCMMQAKYFKKLQKLKRDIFIFFLILLGITVCWYFYQEIALNISTYQYRVKGVINYYNYIIDRPFELWFGNDDLTVNTGSNYVSSFRRIFGYDGTMEFALLNIVIKNGLIGLIGYIYIFIRSFRIALKSSNWTYKTAMIAIIVTMVASALVETYIQTIHAVFGIFGYLAIAGLAGLVHERQQEQLMISENLGKYSIQSSRNTNFRRVRD